MTLIISISCKKTCSISRLQKTLFNLVKFAQSPEKCGRKLKLNLYVQPINHPLYIRIENMPDQNLPETIPAPEKGLTTFEAIQEVPREVLWQAKYDSVILAYP